MPSKKKYKKVIHLRISDEMYDKIQMHAEAHNAVHELREVASMQAYVRCAINFAMDHPNFSERVRMRLAMICNKIERRSECPVKPSDILYEALADLEKKHKL